jgi:hypothetical protein
MKIQYHTQETSKWGCSTVTPNKNEVNKQSKRIISNSWQNKWFKTVSVKSRRKNVVKIKTKSIKTHFTWILITNNSKSRATHNKTSANRSHLFQKAKIRGMTIRDQSPKNKSVGSIKDRSLWIKRLNSSLSILMDYSAARISFHKFRWHPICYRRDRWRINSFKDNHCHYCTRRNHHSQKLQRLKSILYISNKDWPASNNSKSRYCEKWMTFGTKSVGRVLLLSKLTAR